MIRLLKWIINVNIKSTNLDIFFLRLASIGGLEDQNKALNLETLLKANGRI